MCGIIGYAGHGNAIEKLITGLERLEYRGYDSVGISYFDSPEHISTQKSQGRVDNLKEKVRKLSLTGRCGIGHTRWATHGVPSDVNAHPHVTENLSLVHNGIIENYSELKKELSELGYSFVSETDTEAAAKLIDLYYVKEKDPLTAIYRSVLRLRGSYAFGIIFREYSDKIYAVCHGSPVVVAVGDDGNFISSDVPAFLKYTDKYFYLDENEIAQVSESCIDVFDKDGKPVHKDILQADLSPAVAELCGYDHFMQKEICEQPSVISDTVKSVRTADIKEIFFERMFESNEKENWKIHIVACGTAMHAGLVGKFLIEKWARVPVSVWIASEFRYCEPVISKNDVVIAISQSGETADTLAGVRLAKEKGVYTVAVVNVRESSIAREADKVLYTPAGPEMAVASTKAYTSQLAVMYTVALRLSEKVGTVTHGETERQLNILERDVPQAVKEVISRSDEIKRLAEKISRDEKLFFIGRGIDFALALEGSLKLKEISYIHCEGYAAGELKHGAISLVTDGVPVVGVFTLSRLADKTVNNIKEVRARGARTVAIVGEGVSVSEELAASVIKLPPPGEEFSAFSAATALQLLAYHTAVIRGCDVDRPRNLAKSVTVE